MRNILEKNILIPGACCLLASLAILGVTYAFAQVEAERELKNAQLEEFNRLSSLGDKLENAILARFHLLSTLAEHIASVHELGDQEFNRHAMGMMIRNGDIKALQLARDGVITQVYPRDDGGKRLLGTPLTDTMPFAPKQVLSILLKEHKAILVGPFLDGQGEVAALFHIPVAMKRAGSQERWGVTTARLAPRQLIEQAGLKTQNGNLDIALRDKNWDDKSDKVFWGDGSVFSRSPAVIAVKFPGGSWQLGAAPVAEWKRSGDVALTWLFGSVIALLSNGFIWMAIRQPMQLKQEIKERIKAESELKLSEEKYKGLYNSAFVGLFRTSPDNGLFLSVNKTMAELVGFDSPEAMLAQYKAIDIYAEPGQREVFLKQLRESQSIHHFEFTIRTKEGDQRLLSMNARQLVKEGYIEGAVTDITEKKNAERLREDVERIIRHDLKAPLLGIVSIPSLLRSQPNLNEEQRELLGEVEKAGERMLQMIDLSLTIYKMEQGTYQFEPDLVNLPRLLKPIALNLKTLPNSVRVDVRVDGAPAAGDATFQVLGEELLCFTLLSNLVRNAVEASPENGVVTVDFEHRGARQTVAIHNQMEVPQQIRDSFFDKYVTFGKKTGTGLGTYSAKLIAKTLGGDIRMESSHEAGTTITVELPGYDAQQ